MRSIILYILALLAAVLVVTHAKHDKGSGYPGGLRNPPEMFIEEIVGRLVPEIIKYQTPLAVWRTWRIDQALWNCVAHFHGGVLDAITKARPVPVASNELFTSQSRALCMVYAMNKLIPELVPGSTPVIVDFLEEHALETTIMTDQEAFAAAGCNVLGCTGTLDDDSAPRVIGSIVAANVISAMQTDGWNHKGQLKYDKATGEKKPCSKNCSPFQDPTGYKPKNSPWAIDPAFPTRWQPLEEDDGFGYHFVQEHIVPYIGTEAEPAVLTRSEFNNKRLDPPAYDYETETTLVLQRAATLAGSDEQKLMVELMNNKLNLVAGLLVHIREKFSLSLEAQVFFSLGMTSAEVDATLLAWKEKVSHDLIRPTSLIHQKGAESVDSYAGPVPADEWRTYVPVMPHSEYPSGSACLCKAVQEYTDLFVQAHGCIDDDDLLDDGKWTCHDYQEAEECAGGAAGPNWEASWGPLSDYKADEACCACGRGQIHEISTVTPTYVFAAGSSQVQPGQVPGSQVVKTFTSMSEVRDVCGESRLWGGMHFTAAVADGMALCDGIGEASLGRMEELLGDVSFMDLMDAHKWKYGRDKPKVPKDKHVRRRAGTEEAKTEDGAMPNQLPNKQTRREARARQKLEKEALSSSASLPTPAADFFAPGAFLLVVALAFFAVGVHVRRRSRSALLPSLDSTGSGSHQLLATEGRDAETEANVEAEARPVTVGAENSRRRSSACAALEHFTRFPSSLEGGSFLRIRSAGLSRA